MRFFGQSEKVWSFLLAFSLLAGTFSGTAVAAKESAEPLSSQFAVSEPNSVSVAPEFYSDDREDGKFENGPLNYVRPFIDPSYLQQACIPKTLAKAANSFPSSYDLREKQEVSSRIRDQAKWGACWAFAATGSAESTLFPEEKVEFSPRHLAYFTFNGEANSDLQEDGTASDTYHAWAYKPSEVDGWFHPWYEIGGNTFMANATLSRIGFQLDSSVPYPEGEKYFDEQNKDSIGVPALKDAEKWGDVDEAYHFTAPYRLVESNYLPTKDQSGHLDGSAIKKELMNGSSISVSLFSSNYNAVKTSDDKTLMMQVLNASDSVSINHAVQIIGWDDTIPASYFKNEEGIQPKKNGGWLIRNSWGKDWGRMNGCFYLSYEDSSISETCQFIVSAEQPYNHNYQYDGTGWNTTVGVKDHPTAPVSMSNIFTATGDETIEAAAFYTTTYDSSYSIQVYTNLKDETDPASGTKAYETEQTGMEPYAGYHTIELKTPVPVNEGEKFSIVVTVKIPKTAEKMWDSETLYPVACELNGYCGGITSDADCKEGQSFISYDGKKWLDIADYDEPLYGIDGKSEITLANVCLKVFTVDRQNVVLDKSELEAAIASAKQTKNTNSYLYASTSKKNAFDEALKNAEQVLQNLDITQEKTNAAAETLKAKQNALDGKKPSSGSHGGGGGGGGSSKKDSSTSGNGTAVVAATPAPVVTAPAPVKSVKSDTTMDFTVKRGNAYCFKMTVLNGSTAVPSFAVGNGGVLKTQFIAKIGNDYFFRIWAIGAPGTKTGVYTTMPGEAAQLHCLVTVG